MHFAFSPKASYAKCAGEIYIISHTSESEYISHLAKTNISQCASAHYIALRLATYRFYNIITERVSVRDRVPSAVG